MAFPRSRMTIAAAAIVGSLLSACTGTLAGNLLSLIQKGGGPLPPAGAVMTTDDEAGAADLKSSLEKGRSPGLTVSLPTATGQRIGSDRARRVARNFLTRTAGDEPDWRGASLSADAPVVYYDANETDPAAFEFAVLGAGGGAQGRIVVAASPYLLPVPQYSTRGGTRAEALLDAYRKKFGEDPAKPRYYRFSGLSCALEDQAKPANSIVRSRKALDLAKAKVRPRRTALFSGDGEQIAKEWAALDTDVPVKTLRTLSTTSKKLSDVPYYYQHDIGRCVVGCVPVAWGMLYGFYEQNGINTISGGASDNAGPEINANIKTMTEKINDYCLTTCVGGQGSTFCYMTYAGKYWGKTDRGLTVSSTSYALGADTDDFDKVKTEIDAGRPCIVNYEDDIDPSNPGLEGHAVTAYGYSKSGSTRKIYVNMGEEGWYTDTLTVGSGDLNIMLVTKVTVAR